MEPLVRTLVVDDEDLARQRLVRVLSADPGVHVVGEAVDGAHAVELIRATKPELVFLDVQMPRMDGLAVVRALDPEDAPHVVFVTAYNQYLEQAFRARALEYLTKPYTDAQIAATLSYARRRVDERRAHRFGSNRQLLSLLQDLRSSTSGSDRHLTVSGARGEFKRIGIDQIEFIEAAAEAVRIQTADVTHAWRVTLTEAHERLRSEGFVRISRSVIVNTASVVGGESIYRREYSLQLRSGKRLSTGRSYADQVESVLQIERDRRER